MLQSKSFLAISCLSFSFLTPFILSSCASATHQESTGEYVDSSAITLKIKSLFLADDVVKSLPITVKTYKGRVELSGFVDNKIQKHRADEIARHVDGVVSVTDAMVVKNL